VWLELEEGVWAPLFLDSSGLHETYRLLEYSLSSQPTIPAICLQNDFASIRICLVFESADKFRCEPEADVRYQQRNGSIAKREISYVLAVTSDKRSRTLREISEKNKLIPRS
jgi:hypothetical protein